MSTPRGRLAVLVAALVLLAGYREWNIRRHEPGLEQWPRRADGTAPG